MESFRPHRGFTLIELVVVAGIISVIATIVFSSQESFNKSLILSVTAYDVALTIRHAESYGISNRAVGAMANVGHGIHFTVGDSITLFPDSFPVFSTCHTSFASGSPDAQPGNCAYDPTNGGEASQSRTLALGNAITITNLCAKQNNVWTCTSSAGSPISSLDVVFARPNPTAFISVNGVYSPASPITDACITLSSSQGDNKHIAVVSSSGSITANASSCP